MWLLLKVGQVMDHMRLASATFEAAHTVLLTSFFSDMAIPQKYIYHGSEKSLYLPNHTRYSKVTGIFEKPTKFRFRQAINQ